MEREEQGKRERVGEKREEGDRMTKDLSHLYFFSLLFFADFISQTSKLT